MANRKLNLWLGALSRDLKDQLRDQKLELPDTDLRHFQDDADAVCRLHIRGLIPDGEVRRIRQKLVNKIAKKISEAE